MKPLRIIVGENVRRIRIGKELSRDALAKLASVDPRYLGDIERGQGNPTVDFLSSLSMALGVPVADLFEISSQNDARRKVRKSRSRPEGSAK